VSVRVTVAPMRGLGLFFIAAMPVLGPVTGVAVVTLLRAMPVLAVVLRAPVVAALTVVLVLA